MRSDFVSSMISNVTHGFDLTNRRLVAELVGADHDEIVLVANATTGINTILRNFEWKDGDILFGGMFLLDGHSNTTISL